LLKDQERFATLGVPLKINAYPDDVVGKVYEAEQSGRVRGLGFGVCPTKVFGTRKPFSEFVNVGSSSKNIEDLKRLRSSLHKLKVTRHFSPTFCDEFGDELPSFNQGISS